MARPLTDKQPGNNGKKKPRGKPFPKGKSGNPNGRPKNEHSLTALLREALQKQTINGIPIPDGKTAAEFIVDRAVEAAGTGNFQFFKEIFDRLEGKVADKLITQTDGEKAIEAMKESLDRVAEDHQ